jgi:hydrogenase expression/formation protein HypC
MCLALPAKVVALSQSADMAIVALGGVKKEVCIILLDDVQPGDYLLIHVGYALQRVSGKEARRTLELFAETGLSGEPQASI